MTKSKLHGKRIVVLTGAGISSESGLKTFRDHDGLWEGHRIEDVATPEAFARDPELVHQFYNLRRRQLKEAQPNRAHLALAQFESQHRGDFLLVTQNVDDLHDRAGSKNIIHMHGELRKVRCEDTGEIFTWTEDLHTQTPHPRGGGRAGALRPHICWFGEMPYQMEEIYSAVAAAEVFVAIGTSGVVYPAAGLVRSVPSQCRTVLLNKLAADNNPDFDEIILGIATEVVPRFLEV